MSHHERPPDPAGTKPKVDPDSLESVAPLQLPSPAAPRQLEQGGPGGDLELADQGAATVPALPPAPHADRFRFTHGALVGIALAAILATAGILLGTGRLGSSGGVAWSAWKPASKGTDGASQIANHVAGEYRLDNGERLVAVHGGPLKVDNIKLIIAVRRSPTAQIKFLTGDSVLYSMIGSGPKGSIARGKPSPQRHLLLRREGLELALYSFRYMGGIQHVVIEMPPRKGQTADQVLLLNRDDVRESMQEPLSASVPLKTPTPATILTSARAAEIQHLTEPRLFHFAITQDQVDPTHVFLVLDPLSVVQATPSPTPTPIP